MGILVFLLQLRILRGAEEMLVVGTADLCIRMRVDVRVNMRVDMRVDMCIRVCTGMYSQPRTCALTCRENGPVRRHPHALRHLHRREHTCVVSRHDARRRAFRRAVRVADLARVVSGCDVVAKSYHAARVHAVGRRLWNGPVVARVPPIFGDGLYSYGLDSYGPI